MTKANWKAGWPAVVGCVVLLTICVNLVSEAPINILLGIAGIVLSLIIIFIGYVRYRKLYVYHNVAIILARATCREAYQIIQQIKLKHRLASPKLYEKGLVVNEDIFTEIDGKEILYDSFENADFKIVHIPNSVWQKKVNLSGGNNPYAITWGVYSKRYKVHLGVGFMDELNEERETFTEIENLYGKRDKGMFCYCDEEFNRVRMINMETPLNIKKFFLLDKYSDLENKYIDKNIESESEFEARY